MRFEPFKAASAVSFEVTVITFVFSDMISISLNTTSIFFRAKSISLSCFSMLPPTSMTFPEILSAVSAEDWALAVNSSLDAATWVEVCDIFVIKFFKLFFMSLKAVDNSPISSPELIIRSCTCKSPLDTSKTLPWSFSIGSVIEFDSFTQDKIIRIKPTTSNIIYVVCKLFSALKIISSSTTIPSTQPAVGNFI